MEVAGYYDGGEPLNFEPSPSWQHERGLAIVSPGGARLPKHVSPRNPLLVRDEVGKAKATCYDLPPANMPYGHRGGRDVEGAREVTTSWAGQSPRPREEELVPDFRVFNKQAVRSRHCTAKDRGRLIRLEKEIDALPKCSPRSQRQVTRVPPKALPSETVPGWAYGRKVRPSTPIDQVLSYKWASQGEQELSRYYAGMLVMQAEPHTIRKIPLTNAARGHATPANRALLEPVEPKEPFKMKKFKAVPARLNTHRPHPCLEVGPSEEAGVEYNIEDSHVPPAQL